MSTLKLKWRSAVARKFIIPYENWKAEEFVPSKPYLTLAATEDGRRLWEWLNMPTIVAIMAAAGHIPSATAIEAIEAFLIAEFGSELLTDSKKKLVGNMISQIMKKAGFVNNGRKMFVAKNVRCFGSATKYAPIS